MWELDISRDNGASWKNIAKKPSEAACKAYARTVHNTPVQLEPRGWFRLFDAAGQLAFVSADNLGTRVSWHKGNGKPRTKQAGRILGVADI